MIVVANLFRRNKARRRLARRRIGRFVAATTASAFNVVMLVTTLTLLAFLFLVLTPAPVHL